MKFSPHASSNGAPDALRSESAKPCFPFAECVRQQGDWAVKSLTCVREPRRRSRFRSRVSAPLSAKNRVQTCLNVILALVTSAGGSSGCTFHFLCLTPMCPMGGGLGDVECRRLGRSAMMDHKADAVMPLVARLGAWMLYLHGSLVRAQWQPIYHL